jgi:hypothetical protein
VTDFILDANQYTAERTFDKPWGISGQVVLDLLGDRHIGRWHTVLADNWFSSPALAEGYY